MSCEHGRVYGAQDLHGLTQGGCRVLSLTQAPNCCPWHCQQAAAALPFHCTCTQELSEQIFFYHALVSFNGHKSLLACLACLATTCAFNLASVVNTAPSTFDLLNLNCVIEPGDLKQKQTINQLIVFVNL